MIKKNQKGFGVVEAIIIGFVIIALLVIFGWVISKNSNKTSGKSTPAKTTPKPTPSVFDTVSWTGYVKYGTSGTGKDLTSVSGEWVVPTVTLADSMKLTSAWVGIGGYGPNKTLIQVGTDQDTGLLNNGVRVNLYDMMWECFPAPSNELYSIKVSPGDKIQASINKVGASTWALLVNDKTTGSNFQKTVSCAAGEDTAEWILENVHLPGQDDNPNTFPQITSTAFSNIKANGVAPGFANLIKLQLVHGLVKGSPVIARPGDLSNDSRSFTISKVSQ